MTNPPPPVDRRAPYLDPEGRLALPIAPSALAALAPAEPIRALLAGIAQADDPAALCALAEAEPGFAEHVARLASSALLGSGRHLATVAEAQRLLGAPGLRDFAALWLARAVVARLDPLSFNGVAFQQHALRRAALAYVAAQQVGYEDAREAFVAGYLQDLGVAIMAALCPDRAEQLAACVLQPVEERLLWERALGGGAHPEVGARFLASWRLPPGVVAAVAAHHDDVIVVDDRRTERLAELLRLADAVGELSQVDAGAGHLLRARLRLGALRSRRPVTLSRLIDASNALLPAFAALVDVEAPAPRSLEEVLEPPSARAARPVPRPATERGRRSEQLHREKEHLARELRTSRGRLTLIERLDPASGASSRRELWLAMARLIARTVAGAAPLSVLVVEVDAVPGDPEGPCAAALLRELVERLRGTLRAEDLVGRFGTDRPTFAALLPDCGASDAPLVAARVQAALAAQPVQLPDDSEAALVVTLGCVTLPSGGPGSLEEVIEGCARAIAAARSGRVATAW